MFFPPASISPFGTFFISLSDEFIDWVRSYLSDRQQRVKYRKGVFLETVPLGPLSFLINNDEGTTVVWYFNFKYSNKLNNGIYFIYKFRVLNH